MYDDELATGVPGSKGPAPSARATRASRLGIGGEHTTRYDFVECNKKKKKNYTWSLQSPPARRLFLVFGLEDARHHEKGLVEPRLFAYTGQESLASRL